MKLKLILLALILSVLPFTVASGRGEGPEGSDFQGEEVSQELSLTLDGVNLTLVTPFFPSQSIVLPEPDDPVQVANIVQRMPTFNALTVTTIPFGSTNSAEIFLTVEPGKTAEYQEALREYRQLQGGTPTDGPVATFFGQEVTGIMTTVDLNLDVFTPKPVQIVEWVLEAGGRLWVIRASQEIQIMDPLSSSLASETTTIQLGSIQLSAENLDDPSTSAGLIDRLAAEVTVLSEVTDADLPFPSWWDGDCDKNTYYAQTGILSYPLGGSYRGVKACGPRPVYDSAPHAFVTFNPGWWGVLEWECVELSMRFLYLAYGVPTYKANGNQVVTNYSGDKLIKINDGTPGFAPQPNDVLSLGPETPFGHTSVVTASSVDQLGNGTISVLEENSSPTGVRNYTVSNWKVQSSFTVIGWLHDPTNSDTTPPTGDILDPDGSQTFQTGSIHLEAWATDDDSGLDSAQFIANYDGGWHDVGPAFSNFLFSYDWDWCQDSVPNGPISLALRLTDKQGNQTAGYPGLRHVEKKYTCPPNPACTPTNLQVALFKEPNFEGDCQLLGAGTYLNNSSFPNVGDNETASILVGTNVMAAIFSEDQVQGRRETLPGDDSNLSDNLVGSDSLSSVSVMAGDSLPAVPSQQWPPNLSSYLDTQSISLFWQDEGGASQFRTTVDGPSLSETTPWGTSITWSLGSFSPGIYSWRVQARNASGDSAWSLWHFFIISADPNPIPAAVSAPYVDALEADTSKWRATGLWHLTTSQALSPTHSWWYGQEANSTYDTGTSNFGSLTSPPVAIPPHTDPYALQFWSKYDTESQHLHWDQRRVQVSVDGSDFRDVYRLKNDPMGTWLSARIDLSPYYSPGESHIIQVRFYFTTLDDIANARQGWFIDDVQIQALPPVPCAYPHEPNDTSSAATSLAYGDTLSAEICPGGDVDYYTFSGTAGDQIVVDVDAKTLGSQLDGLVYLLDSDGTSILAVHDDEIANIRQDPHLGYRLPRNGIYYLKIQAWDNPMGTGEYTVTLFKDPTPPNILSTFPSTGSYLPSAEITIQAAVSDSLSGISHVEFLGFANGWGQIRDDWDSADGWTASFNTTGLSEGDQIHFYTRAYDWAGNQTGTPAWDVTLDFSPPHTTAPPLPDPNDSTAVKLTWSSADNLAGIRSYHVRHRKNIEDWITQSFDKHTTSWWFTGEAGNVYTFRIRATDEAGNIEPYLEGAEVDTTIPVINTLCSSPDPWDTSASANDNHYSNATPLPTSWQTHNFCNPAATNRLFDTDWLKLWANPGQTYTISAQPLHESAAVVIQLYASNGATLLSESNPLQFGDPTSLVWHSSQEGWVYLQLRHLDGRVAGNSVDYQVIFTESEGTVLYFPLIRR